MLDSLAALVLAAGAGERMRPLSGLRPKALLPLGDSTLLDVNLARVAAITGVGPASIAVNAHHHAGQLRSHLGERVHLSVEEREPLGTAGAVGHLREWLDGRPVLVVNGDTWTTVDLWPLVDGWTGERARVLLLGAPGSVGELRPGWPVVASLLPAGTAAALPAVPLGLSNGVWFPEQEAGRLEVVAVGGRFVSCDRPGDHLAANLAWSGGASVLGDGAVVDGEVDRCVVWPGGIVRRGERLVDAIRTDAGTTVLIR